MVNENKHTEMKFKPKPTCKLKNCSHVYVYHCAELSYTRQHKTVLIIFLLTSRQSSKLRCCLLERRGNKLKAL